MFEEGDLVIVTNRTGYAHVRVGMYGTVLQTYKQHGETFIKVDFEQSPYAQWINSGDLRLVLDPVDILGEEYFA